VRTRFFANLGRSSHAAAVLLITLRTSRLLVLSFFSLRARVRLKKSKLQGPDSSRDVESLRACRRLAQNFRHFRMVVRRSDLFWRLPIFVSQGKIGPISNEYSGSFFGTSLSRMM
jgi:hypothetical protein